MMLFPTTRDPIEDDPFVIQARAEEAEREQRWTEFVTRLKERAQELDWREVVWDAYCAMGRANSDYDFAFMREMRDFAETEGWPGVLTAIALAMREAEQAQQELMDRR